MYTACEQTVKRSGASRELTPISNLPVQSKMLERLVAQQLQYYLCTAGLLPTLQSGFRPRYSAETVRPLLRSTRSTITFCCRGYRQASALAALPLSGSSRT